MENKPNTGVLFKNSYKTEGDNKPYYKGTINVNGVECELAAWVKEGQNGKFLSLKATPKEEKPAQPVAPAEIQEPVDDLPF